MSSGPEGTGGPGPASWDDLIARLLRMPETRRPVYRVDISQLMSADARDLLADAARRAGAAAQHDIDTNHLLWAALQRDALRALVQPGRRRPGHPAGHGSERRGRRRTARGAGPPKGCRSPRPPSARCCDAHQISRAMGSSYIGPEHILMALPVNPESPAGRMLAARPGRPESLRGRRAAERGRRWPGRPDREHPDPGPVRPGPHRRWPATASSSRWSAARSEIEQAVEVLSRRTKNNPVLIGEAGVGKTAIVEGIAERIVEGDVPQTLHGKRVIQLDLAGLVAGTRYRGDFEERLKKVIDEVREHGDELIIFLDEVHTLVGAGGAGSEGGMDASNMLKPALARGELRVIGATTLDEYRRSIEKDAALARRFQPILVPEPSVDDTVAILRGLRDRYEAHHQVRFTDEALVAAAELSDRYIADRFLPDKAIDLIDQAGARVRLRTGTPAPATAGAGAAARAAAPGQGAGGRRRAVRAGLRAARPDRRGCGQQLDAGPATRPATGVPEVGVAGDRRGGLPGHRHPGQPAHRGGAGPAAAAGGAPARAGGRAGRGGRRGRRGRTPVPGRAGRPEPAGRAASCSSDRPASARPSWPGRWPRRCSATRTGWSGWT